MEITEKKIWQAPELIDLDVVFTENGGPDNSSDGEIDFSYNLG